MSDLSSMGYSELLALAAQVDSEVQRRTHLKQLATDARRLGQEYSAASGRSPGDEYVKPTGAHDAYWIGDTVTFEDKVYTSTIDGNFLSPSEGPAYWLTMTPTDEILDFVKPTGAHDAIPLGAKRRYNGRVYESLIDNNTYSPDEYPSGWKELQ